jgi:hypothetical protein
VEETLQVQREVRHEKKGRVGNPCMKERRREKEMER